MLPTKYDLFQGKPITSTDIGPAKKRIIKAITAVHDIYPIIGQKVEYLELVCKRELMYCIPTTLTSDMVPRHLIHKNKNTDTQILLSHWMQAVDQLLLHFSSSAHPSVLAPVQNKILGQGHTEKKLLDLFILCFFHVKIILNR